MSEPAWPAVGEEAEKVLAELEALRELAKAADDNARARRSFDHVHGEDEELFAKLDALRRVEAVRDGREP